MGQASLKLLISLPLAHENTPQSTTLDLTACSLVRTLLVPTANLADVHPPEMPKLSDTRHHQTPALQLSYTVLGWLEQGLRLISNTAHTRVPRKKKKSLTYFKRSTRLVRTSVFVKSWNVAGPEPNYPGLSSSQITKYLLPTLGI